VSLSRDIDVIEMAERINAAGIAKLENHPACTEVYLRDGSKITFWDGSLEHESSYELTERAGRQP
jgi:hypothetical protein